MAEGWEESQFQNYCHKKKKLKRATKCWIFEKLNIFSIKRGKKIPQIKKKNSTVGFNLEKNLHTSVLDVKESELEKPPPPLTLQNAKKFISLQKIKNNLTLKKKKNIKWQVCIWLFSQIHRTKDHSSLYQKLNRSFHLQKFTPFLSTPANS